MAKILIIDDDPDIVETLKVVLEKNGHSVDSAANSEEGFEQIKKSPPQLLILDVMMNGMQDGFDLARKIKKDSRYKQIPILMLTAIMEKTGFDFKPAVGDEEWLPVEDFLDKPVKPEVLLSKVEKLLSKK